MAEYHYVYGVVYSPLQVDTDWETITPEGLRKMAHDFIAEGNVRKIDIMHDNKPYQLEVVESFIARKDDPDYPEGSWVLGVRIPDSEIWELVKSGTLNGFSVELTALKVPKQVAVDIAKIALGSTEPNTSGDVPEHTHEYYIEFDSDGSVILGTTSEVYDHSHEIVATVVTQKAAGHNHRYFVD